MEIESDLEARLMKFEFESTFGSDLDSSFDYKYNAFPKHLNPGFDLQIMLKVSDLVMNNATKYSFSMPN